MFLAKSVIDEVKRIGTIDFCVCPGARNAQFIQNLKKDREANSYYFYDERAAAFFACGKARYRPACVITTSGTAVGELLPAAMEAYHAGLPLILITADRPRRLRGTGAPQTCEQVAIFGKYVLFERDLADNDSLDLEPWSRRGPCHINACFEE